MARNVQKNVGNVGSDMILNQIEQQFQVVIKKMILRTKQKSHERTMRELERKLQIAKMKCEERNLKYKILKSYIPFHIKPKFNKLIVLLSIVAIISYTIAAILLQKYTLVELSPTLTTCVYGFFGTELLGLAGIKIFDTKYQQIENNVTENIIENDPDAVG